MRVFIAVIVLIFGFQSLVRADDIRDFQIEGISIGDSLLDYFSEKELKQKKKKGFIYPNKKYYSVSFFSSKYEIYEKVQFHLKSTDKKYIVYAISGLLYFRNNIKNCHKTMDEVVADISELFENVEIKNSGFQNHPADKTGKSKTKTVFFKFNTGDNIIVGCADFSKELTNKKGWKDHLRVEIRIDEFFKWMKYEAYK
jgi:hypothetical protein